jgi:hypothetical protein
MQLFKRIIISDNSEDASEEFLKSIEQPQINIYDGVEKLIVDQLPDPPKNPDEMRACMHTFMCQSSALATICAQLMGKVGVIRDDKGFEDYIDEIFTIMHGIAHEQRQQIKKDIEQINETVANLQPTESQQKPIYH